MLYYTKDINLAAYLVTKGHSVQDVRFVSQNTVFFDFENTEELKKLADEFFDKNDTLVNMPKFMANRKALIGEIQALKEKTLNKK